MDSLKDAWNKFMTDCCKQDATVKEIAVVGATGQQGGGLVRAILDDPKGGFKVRALTRDPSKPKAEALKKAGARVVKFDLDLPSTLPQALKGVYGVFAVTNFWEHLSVEKEKAQAKAIADAATAAGVQHVIWSTLEGTTTFFDSLPDEERPNKLDGYYVPHFDGKHESNAYFPPSITTNLYTSFYLDNFDSFGMVRDGVLCVNMGDDVPLPVIAAEDIGKCAYGIFKAGDKYMGKNVYIAGDIMTCKDLMDLASEVTGQGFEYQPVSRETYSTFDFPGANDMANMFYFKVKNNEDFCEKRNPKTAKDLNPDLQSVQMWLENNVDDMRNLAKPLPEQPALTNVAKSAPKQHASSSMEVSDDSNQNEAIAAAAAPDASSELWA